MRAGQNSNSTGLWRLVFVVIFSFLLLPPRLSFGSEGAPDLAGWTLVWSDEFNGPNGSRVDASKWTMETGGGGWGNNELQYYTNSSDNAYQENGSLIIKVIKETYTGPDGVTRNYTSARLKTQGKFEQAYGRFEARLKVPFGQGIWPAFWMLGNNINQVGWPQCGEIDIMENIGREPSTVHGTVHGPGYSGASGIGAPYTLPDGERFADAFHVFAVEWEPREIRWYVDGNLYYTLKPDKLPAGAAWVFDHPFFLLLNVAVGGNWPGSPDESTSFPQVMMVDYVRVYQRKVASVSAASYNGATLASGAIVAAFGSHLATVTESASTIPLPTTLGGTRVKIKDGAGIEHDAPLFFVSPFQVNYQIPTETIAGKASVTVTSADGYTSIGTSDIAAVAPGLFTFNADGQGVGAGYALRYSNGQQHIEPIAQLDARNKWIPLPINLGPETDQVFLILFGTGIRFHSSLALAVTIKIGGVDAEVLYAGPQGDFVGLDQLNIRLPRTLAGRGEIDVALNIDGRSANPVRISIS